MKPPLCFVRMEQLVLFGLEATLRPHNRCLPCDLRPPNIRPRMPRLLQTQHHKGPGHRSTLRPQTFLMRRNVPTRCLMHKLLVPRQMTLRRFPSSNVEPDG